MITNMHSAVLKEHLDKSTDESPLLLDVREKWEFSICRLEGSVNIPMPHIRNHIAEFDSSREIVVICHHGVRSLVVCRYLEQNGFTNLINLTGGVAGWANYVDPSMETY